MQTTLIHGDDGYRPTSAVAPEISVSTTFRHPEPREDDEPGHPVDYDPANPTRHVYSRYTQGVSTRVEKLLGQICQGHAVTYASGLAAGYAALVHYKPKRIAIRGGYHGFHMSISVYQSSNSSVELIDLDDPYMPGDLVWVESPLNPTGEVRNLKHYADRAHAAGCKLVVDSTFAPPPLQNPFAQGADCVMHSGTKYFGGHSDLLCGVLVVQSQEEWMELWQDRTFLGSMMGSLESWLLLRSLRTLPIRVAKQSRTATELAKWLDRIAHTPKGETWDCVPGGVIEQVWHSSLQKESGEAWFKDQMKGGSACFAMHLHDPKHANKLPNLLEYFVSATSLGGVESLIEQRVISDPGANPKLCRLSIGLEDLEDLKADFRQAFGKLLRPAKL
ncbi:cystathionine gamma-synthase [Dacryopinax primogenitus]|uniref:Cystathionine gamma-synthase n=1 Tax=Dacryopinax primogenitus (strain DJM 731) TaxID=1858805 RepID=M5GH20_DACPD|nr:cystathionine gamma-synthase [Dacryopinax primogenitus]EJU06473.1 cystathionine gamma-synthase [Dacryopinax primogenitus]